MLRWRRRANVDLQLNYLFIYLLLFFSWPAMLLRWSDDFFYVSTNRDLVERFVTTMLTGFPEYGALCNLEKALVNFEMTYRGRPLPMALTTGMKASSFALGLSLHL
jgi:hypothetical protein